jgi:hypothetical protein
MKNRVARLLSLGIALAAVSVVHAQDKGMNTNMSFPSRGLEPGASDLNPFTNRAYIPAGADLSSIRYAGAKAVNVAVKRVSATNRDYCENLQEPGGSMYCPSVKDESPTPAYRISFSYNGSPMASDEYGSRRFTFSVYFRPDELDSTVRRSISAGHSGWADAAAYFNVTTSRDAVPLVVIDEANSTWCEGSYVDGAWTHTISKCEDKITYRTVKVPSSYITVKVERAASISASSR